MLQNTRLPSLDTELRIQTDAVRTEIDFIIKYAIFVLNNKQKCDSKSMAKFSLWSTTRVGCVNSCGLSDGHLEVFNNVEHFAKY